MCVEKCSNFMDELILQELHKIPEPISLIIINNNLHYVTCHVMVEAERSFIFLLY